MSSRARGVLTQIIDRIVDGPKCACGHLMSIHYINGCLGALYDKEGTAAGWCTCPVKGKKEKHEHH